MVSTKDFLQTKMDHFSGYFWLFVSNIKQTLFIFRFLNRIFTRFFKTEKTSEACSSTLSQESNQIGTYFSELKDDSFNTDNAGHEECKTSHLVFKFQYQTWNHTEELSARHSESSDFEPCFHSNDGSFEKEDINASGFLSKRDFMKENFTETVKKEEIEEKLMAASHAEEQCDSRKDQMESLNNNLGTEEISTQDNFLSENDFICGSNLDSLVEDQLNGLVGGKFLSDRDFETTIEDHNEDRDIMEKMLLSGNSFHDHNNSEPENFGDQENRLIDYSEESAKPNLQYSTLWEQLGLVEQEKMEMKKVKATGLPTILEDSESPRIMEDLKPWNFDEKFQHGNTIKELPKLYRIYRERMWKFDILNHQKMYAIGLVLSKSKEASAMESLFYLPFPYSLSSSPCKGEKGEMKKLTRELYSEMEVVYVGQLCLSWEMLQWEYGKALEIWESDHCGFPRYNEVGREFQHFQVLLQRFIENEPFQDPRLEAYLKQRCVMRNLLQVPLLREDKRKVRKRGRESEGVTSEMVVEMMEECIRTMWRFIRTDKQASSSFTPKGVGDSVREDLEKKEKRVREHMRSRSSIWKKLKKREGDGEDDDDGDDEVLYFLSEVDMKLVRRVLGMRKITKDQLKWCHDKLNKISFVNGRIHVEPSFLLFPFS